MHHVYTFTIYLVEFALALLVSNAAGHRLRVSHLVPQTHCLVADTLTKNVAAA